jgi:hypothetical protein
VQLTDYWTIFPTISPDGKLIAAGYLDEQQIPHFAIIPSLGGQPTKILPMPVNGGSDCRTRMDTGLQHADLRAEAQRRLQHLEPTHQRRTHPNS